MNILITGVGFIGFHLAQYHAARGDTVHLLDNLGFPRPRARGMLNLTGCTAAQCARHLLDLTLAHWQSGDS